MNEKEKFETLSYNFKFDMSPNKVNGGRVERSIIHKGSEKG